MSKARHGMATDLPTDLPGLLAFLILALLATGVELGEQLQPARILVGCALLWLVLSNGLQFWGRALLSICYLGCLWMAWGGLSLAWSPDSAAGAREMLGIGLGLVTVCVVIWLVRAARASLTVIRAGWVAAVILTLPVAAYEMITDHHLPNSYGQLEAGGEESLSVIYAAVTFGNRNTYVAFLTLALPFLLWAAASAGRRLPRILLYMLAAAVFFVVMVDASRIGALLVSGQILLWLFWFVKRRLARALAIGGLAAAFLGALYFLPFTAIRFAVAVSGADSSIDSRYGLMRAGIHFLTETAGLGIGAGGYDKAVTTGLNPYATGGMVNPHNVWIQIFSQYGLPVGLAFCGCLFVWTARLARFTRHAADSDDRIAARAALLLLLSLPLNGILNSSYLSFTFLWAAIGCALAICDRCLLEHLRPRISRVSRVTQSAAQVAT